MTQKAEADVSRKSYNHACLVAQTLDVLGDRWTLLILRDLMGGLHRYTDILDNCQGMSPNVLSDRLKRLEADGLVNRQYHRELPPRVEYTLTEKGWSVRPILLALIDWGREYLKPISAESVGTEMTTDFAVRMIPTFSFQPHRAADLTTRMVIEISDCTDCNTWTFDIHDGHIHPRRHAVDDVELRLKTDTAGFFRFIRGEAPPEACGELLGDPEAAATIQSCFLTD
jgi:DNA-binding HxlR family transcriptional regulator